MRMSNVQSACISLTIRSLGDPRHTNASELVRLLEASYLFTRCATKGPGKTIAFDLCKLSRVLPGIEADMGSVSVAFDHGSRVYGRSTCRNDAIYHLCPWAA
jgi:hypothetical protein